MKAAQKLVLGGFGLLWLQAVTLAPAQTFTTLHSFPATSGPNSTNYDGATPNFAGLILSGDTLYGTTALGGTNGNGTVFAINPAADGALTNLYAFTPVAGSNFTNGDGASPNAGLILSGGTLYGLAAYGGTNGSGTVFAIHTDGTGFTTLHHFAALVSGTNSDGAQPLTGLLLSGNALYGTAEDGGTNGYGTVFAISTNGSDFSVLHTFSAIATNQLLNLYTNSDGAYPVAGLIVAGNILYGTAQSGGTNGNGTVFAVNTDGTGFTILHTFGEMSGINSTNSDGAYPVGGLILSDNTMYGTAYYGGTNGNGAVYALNTDGTGFTTLYNFTAASGSNSTNTDGANPESGLILSGYILYGTANTGGTNGSGTVFAINTNGAGFTTLHSFAPLVAQTNSDGANPNAGLILSGTTLYGTASAGGLDGNGVVFDISFPSPLLTITLSGTNANVTWPSGVPGFSYDGYTLQSTTNLVSPVSWIPVSVTPVVGNGQNSVTDPISDPQQFYRLSQ